MSEKNKGFCQIAELLKEHDKGNHYEKTNA